MPDSVGQVCLLDATGLLRPSQRTFEEVPNSGMAVYYKCRGDEGGWQPFPEGLKYLSGNNSARSYDASTLTATSGGRPVADRVRI